MKPLFEKALIRPLRFNAGEGRSELAALKFAVVESLLPNRIGQLGPPSWIETNNFNRKRIRF